MTRDRTPGPLDILRGRYRQLEAEIVRTALEGSGWVVTRAAATLGAHENQIRRILARNPGIMASKPRSDAAK